MVNYCRTINTNFRKPISEPHSPCWWYPFNLNKFDRVGSSSINDMMVCGYGQFGVIGACYQDNTLNWLWERWSQA